MTTLDHFREVWLCDFEFSAPPGERPTPLCLVALEYRTKRMIRLWADELGPVPPFNVGADTLFVAYLASAEIGCFLSLGWQIPDRILDLCVEFKCHTSGLTVPHGRGLLGALSWHGIDGINATEKSAMRELAIRGGPYTDHEKWALLDYCETDVVALDKLLPAMLPRIDLPRALLRGRYMAAAARIEHQGVPIDTELLERLRSNWSRIKSRLIVEVDQDFGVYVPTGVTLDPNTPLGAAIIREAEAYDVSAYDVAEAVNYLWQQETEAGEHSAAVKAARKATGLTPSRVAALENKGRDFSTVEGFDTKARELASELPGLGLGQGYVGGERDDNDYAANLWSLLREPANRRTKLDIVTRAAAHIATNGSDALDRSFSFNTARFVEYLVREDLPWPRLETGALDMRDDTFSQMAKVYPQIGPLRELRHSLSQMRLNELAVGGDGRNRSTLGVFNSKTGRNQPSNAKFIFGPSVWLRSLIRPAPRRAVAYLDWSQQEFGIAAALSGDTNMRQAYLSGDPYLEFAKQAGAVPPDATKQSHKAERERFKVCALGVMFGMAEQSIAFKIGQTPAHARELLQKHREVYPTFWAWSQAAVDHAMIYNYLEATFGWRTHVGPLTTPRSLANFPMQANGAEMLRLACCLATEAGIAVCAPVHDAVLIESTEADIDAAIETTEAAMREASRLVLAGFELRNDRHIVAWPDRYIDERGVKMFELVESMLWESVESIPF